MYLFGVSGKMGRRKTTHGLAYEAMSVLDVLKKMKNVSSLMMDLSYYSFIYNNKTIAKKVHELEEEIERLNYLLIMNGTLAVRDREDAEAVAGIIQIGNAIALISNAAADVAKIVLDGLAPMDLVIQAFNRAEEIVVSVKVTKDSELVGKRVEFLEKSDIFVDVIALKEAKGEWILDPPGDIVIREGTTIIARGTDDQIEKLFNINGQPYPFEKIKEKGEEDEGTTLKGREILLERIIEMKDKIELMLDLAYSSLILNDVDIADQVMDFENYFDWLQSDFEFLVTSLMNQLNVDKSQLVALIRLGVAAESMADGAAKIAEIVSRGLKPHPILRRVINESEEFLIAKKIKKGSSLIGKSVGYLEEKFGVQVVAVARNGKYHLDTDEDFILNEGDVIIIRGYEEAKEDLFKALG